MADDLFNGPDLWERYEVPDLEGQCESVAPITLRRCGKDKGHFGLHSADGVGGWNRGRDEYPQIEIRLTAEDEETVRRAWDAGMNVDTGE